MSKCCLSLTSAYSSRCCLKRRARAIASPRVYVAEGFVSAPSIFTWLWSLVHFLAIELVSMFAARKTNSFWWGLPKLHEAKKHSWAPRLNSLCHSFNHRILDLLGCSPRASFFSRRATKTKTSIAKASRLPNKVLSSLWSKPLGSLYERMAGCAAAEKVVHGGAMRKLSKRSDSNMKMVHWITLRSAMLYCELKDKSMTGPHTTPNRTSSLVTTPAPPQSSNLRPTGLGMVSKSEAPSPAEAPRCLSSGPTQNPASFANSSNIESRWAKTTVGSLSI